MAEKLTGAHVYFDVVTVGATINLMMASCMAEGETILENAVFVFFFTIKKLR